MPAGEGDAVEQHARGRDGIQVDLQDYSFRKAAILGSRVHHGMARSEAQADEVSEAFLCIQSTRQRTGTSSPGDTLAVQSNPGLRPC